MFIAKYAYLSHFSLWELPIIKEFGTFFNKVYLLMFVNVLTNMN